MVRRSSDLQFVDHLPVEWACADIEDASGVALACQDVDMVCHCAALTRALEEKTLLRVNAGATVQLARLALEANPGLERFLFVSSAMAAGPSADADDIQDETSSPAPITWYGRSKLAAEKGLLELADRLPVTIVRPVAVFGPRDRDFRVYFTMVKRRLALELGGGERAIPFIYIDDLIVLLLLALESRKAEGETYFGVGETASYTQFSRAVAAAMGKRPVTFTLPVRALGAMALWAKIQGRLTGRPALLNEQRIREMRCYYWLYSGEKAWQDLGFRAHWYEKAGWI
jgi:nucleoside-diphosphate-sugar epimerase